MAEETPENLNEEVRAGGGDDPTKSVEAVAAAEGETAPEAAPAETPAAHAAPKGQTRREKLEARRAARRPAPRGQVSPEQRDEERRARRAATAKQRRAYRAKLKERRAATHASAPAAEPAHAPEHGPGRPKVRQGIVISDKADKTIVVRVDIARRHKRYHKILRSSITLHAHDEANDAHTGDTVRVQECRPMSRTKRWRLLDVLERAR